MLSDPTSIVLRLPMLLLTQISLSRQWRTNQQRKQLRLVRAAKPTTRVLILTKLSIAQVMTSTINCSACKIAATKAATYYASTAPTSYRRGHGRQFSLRPLFVIAGIEILSDSGSSRPIIPSHPAIGVHFPKLMTFDSGFKPTLLSNSTTFLDHSVKDANKPL
jgi:hypothetical protein